jgi:hypothetical protein
MSREITNAAWAAFGTYKRSSGLSRLGDGGPFTDGFVAGVEWEHSRATTATSAVESGLAKSPENDIRKEPHTVDAAGAPSTHGGNP